MIDLCLGKDSCGGDVGGPLVFRNSEEEPFYQVGIMSYGGKQCGVYPSAYTRLDVYMDWIGSKLEL